MSPLSCINHFICGANKEGGFFVSQKLSTLRFCLVLSSHTLGYMFVWLPSPTEPAMGYIYIFLNEYMYSFKSHLSISLVWCKMKP